MLLPDHCRRLVQVLRVAVLSRVWIVGVAKVTPPHSGVNGAPRRRRSGAPPFLNTSAPAACDREDPGFRHRRSEPPSRTLLPPGAVGKR